MSREDRQKWDCRYEDGAYVTRCYPSTVLVEFLSALPRGDGISRGRVLDVACGAGRNAIHLAQSGFEVDALDISPVALEKAKKKAAALGLSSINFINWDFDDGLPASSRYDAIIVVRYLNLDLFRLFHQRLNSEGKVLIETHLVCDNPSVGPKSRAFRVKHGELRDALCNLIVEYEYEGLVRDPDGRDACVSRILARKP